MDLGTQNGARTDHDRDSQFNGANGIPATKLEPAPDEIQRNLDTNDSGIVNGGSTVVMNSEMQRQDTTGEQERRSKMNDLPDELVHITQNFIPLDLILTRLAQRSHNELQDKVMDLARMKVSSAIPNGNADFHNLSDDSTRENVDKKVKLLNFAQDLHAKWVKALVITEWSKKSDLVSKLIDINSYILEQKRQFDSAFENLADLKRTLYAARLPSPDLKTALQVLSTGSAPWVPEFGFVPPVPLTAREQLKWMENINTLLSMRLSLDEYDTIPPQFRGYSINSGRVTFTVKGEFELDLTIADEDFEKQFWFIDFRFLFSPAPSLLSDGLRMRLESMVNDILSTDGLNGCYRFLHEFVLTHKINEFLRQAWELARGRWVDVLKIERLNRAMSIQYWASRSGPNVSKSWVILGVHSGKATAAAVDPGSSSHLSLRWFKDNKEIKDTTITLDVEQISTEKLLKTIIGKHIERILSTMHTNLQAKPRFSMREASMSLHISEEEPMNSALVVQSTSSSKITVKIDPITGFFSMAPHSRVVCQGEGRLNWTHKDLAEEGLSCIENIRCIAAMEELNRRGKSMGWAVVRQPIKLEELRLLINTRDHIQTVWLRRQGWYTPWYLMTTLSLSGDKWWLIELTGTPTNLKVKTGISLPLSGPPYFSEGFFSHLTTFASVIISQHTDIQTLYDKKIMHIVQDTNNCYIPPQIQIPAILIRLTDLISSTAPGNGEKKPPKKPWAADYVRIMFWGAQRPPPRGDASGVQKKRKVLVSLGDGKIRPISVPSGDTGVIAEAHLRVTGESKFREVLKTRVGRNVIFDKRAGIFILRLRVEVGQSVIDILSRRLRAIQRLVDFVDAIQQNGRNIQCEKLTLDEIVFGYGDWSATQIPRTQLLPVKLLMRRFDNARIVLKKDNPHLRVRDMLVKLVNAPAGLQTLHFWLSVTLPVMRALNKMEKNWQQIQSNGQGTLTTLIKALDWVTIRFTLPGPSDRPRVLSLDVKAKSRKEEPYWHLWRTDEVVSSHDEFGKALEKIWEGQGDGWVGRSTGATAIPAAGIEHLLLGIDQAVRALVGTPAPPAPTRTDAAAAAAGASSASTIGQRSTAGPPQAPRQAPKKQSPQMARSSGSQHQRDAQPPAQMGGSNSKNAVVVID